MTAGARTLRIVVVLILVAALLAAVAAAWFRTEHPRPAPEEAGHDHAAVVSLPMAPSGSLHAAPSVPRGCGLPATCT